MKHAIAFACIRIITFPISLLPYPALHALGNRLGRLAFYLMPKFRKRALSNLALASDLHLSNEEIVEIAKQSFGNLMITCLEYPKLARETDISRIATCENPEVADSTGKPIIFFCAHQANWELLFLEGTQRMPGVAIGRPVKNTLLYDWVLAIRQKYGGKIITPKEAVKEGLRGLKKGSFLGIVGDQGMPDSGFHSDFLGRRAWTSPLPALLAYRTGSPLIFASVRREKGRYFIHYHPPFWPDTNAQSEAEVQRLTTGVLAQLEESIKKHPGQWLWQHNRWKQQTLGKIKRKFRQDTILIIVEDDLPLHTFRELYPLEFITVLAPKKVVLKDAEILTYFEPDEMLLDDYRFKLVFNLTSNSRVRSHYLSLSAVAVVDLDDLKKLAPGETTFPNILKKALSHAS
jgi:KDO2-lipid IV(A) lauroyltransferase